MVLKLVINDNCEENVSKHINVFPGKSSLFGLSHAEAQILNRALRNIYPSNQPTSLADPVS